MQENKGHMNSKNWWEGAIETGEYEQQGGDSSRWRDVTSEKVLKVGDAQYISTILSGIKFENNSALSMK